MGWQPIIVGFDGTPESLRAAEVAVTIAHAAQARLVPVQAVPVIPAFSGVAGMEPMPVFSPELQGELSRATREQAIRALENVLPPRAVQQLEVHTGPAPFVLAEVARRLQAGLVVLGGKHHGALARGLGRSTAHYLIRTLDVPVLVVGASAAPIARILAAVDLSAASLPTVMAAERFARLLGARLRLLHAVEPVRFTYLAADQWDEAAYERNSQENFERFATPFEHVAPEDRVVRQGAPAEAIAAEADAWRADIVVVGSHGKGWVDRILVGSTTERLVTELPSSILVVPVKSTLQRRSPKRSTRRRARAQLKER
jgi:nucleotide-binding universal stress UspA family protein